MRTRSILVGLTTLGLAAAAWAATPAQNIEARQANFKQIGRAFKGINDEFKKDAPDAMLIRTNARIIDSHAPHVARWFPAGTGAEAGVKTGAAPAIWTDRAGFNTAARNFAVAARAFKNAANRNDLAVTKTAAMAVGPTCKGCHDKFKLKD